MNRARSNSECELIPLSQISYHSINSNTCQDVGIQQTPNHSLRVSNPRLVLVLHFVLFVLSILFSSVLFLIRDDHPTLVSGFSEGQSMCIVENLKTLQGQFEFPSNFSDDDKIHSLLSCTPSINLHLTVHLCKHDSSNRNLHFSTNYQCEIKSKPLPGLTDNCISRFIPIDPRNLTYTFFQVFDLTQSPQIFELDESRNLISYYESKNWYQDLVALNDLRYYISQSSVAPFQELLYFRPMSEQVTLVFDPQHLILSNLKGRHLRFKYLSGDYAYRWKVIPRVIVTDDRGWLAGRFCVHTAIMLDRE